MVPIQLVAVQRHAGLEPKGVAAAQAAGLEPEGLARHADRLPQRLCVGCQAEQLEAVFAGVAGARDEALDPGHLAGRGVVVTEDVEVGVGEGLEELRRSGTLGRDQARGVAAVLKYGVETTRGEQRAQVLQVRLLVGGIAHHQEALVDAVDDQVVDDATVPGADHRVLRLSRRQAHRIGDHAVPQECQRVRWQKSKTGDWEPDRVWQSDEHVLVVAHDLQCAE